MVVVGSLLVDRVRLVDTCCSRVDDSVRDVLPGSASFWPSGFWLPNGGKLPRTRLWNSDGWRQLEVADGCLCGVQDYRWRCSFSSGGRYEWQQQTTAKPWQWTAAATDNNSDNRQQRKPRRFGRRQRKTRFASSMEKAAAKSADSGGKGRNRQRRGQREKVHARESGSRASFKVTVCVSWFYRTN
ncbi:hypothetical protein GW17_00014377 [Ensete ventricosum]|nr:hypothetical protein GW17_00014377 [Ensete ventricosum]